MLELLLPMDRREREGKMELDRTAAGGKRDKGARGEGVEGSDAWKICSRIWQGWSAQWQLQSRNRAAPEEEEKGNFLRTCL
jgi:hypothetical protein